MTKYLNSKATLDFMRRVGCCNLISAVGTIAILKDMDASGELESAPATRIWEALGGSFGGLRARDLVSAYRLFLAEDRREKATNRQRRYRQKLNAALARKA